ncbi:MULTISPECIES: hypothetical protein [Shewanella]|uniref:hypothetical protein n=1 Tax=Shewanella TaxID=22 RepID=UPI001CBA6102|nr:MULTISPECIES: hypothetical protein [Shewanella]
MKNRCLLLLSTLLLLSGCNLANHGSFIAQTYHSNFDGGEKELVALGLVEGKSCQTSAVYLIPYGESASTQGAIADAKSRIEGTVFLTDVAIDDKLWLEFGYSVQCILVTATAYGEKRDSVPQQ